VEDSVIEVDPEEVIEEDSEAEEATVEVSEAEEVIEAVEHQEAEEAASVPAPRCSSSPTRDSQESTS